MTDVFISHAHSTAARARAVAEAERALGYGVWWEDELPARPGLRRGVGWTAGD